jgi:hypothetical protein
MGFWPGQKIIPWYQVPGGPEMTPGRCLCDNWVLNELADTVLEALPMIVTLVDYCRLARLRACIYRHLLAR